MYNKHTFFALQVNDKGKCMLEKIGQRNDFAYSYWLTIIGSHVDTLVSSVWLNGISLHKDAICSKHLSGENI